MLAEFLAGELASVECEMAGIVAGEPALSVQTA
jgi:hypothetical protein